MSQPTLLVVFGGTRAIVNYYDHFTPFSDVLGECHRCSSLTPDPASHLQWHQDQGENVLAAPTGEHDDHHG